MFLKPSNIRLKEYSIIKASNIRRFKKLKRCSKFVEYSRPSNIRRIYFEKIFFEKKIRRIFEGFFLVEYSTNLIFRKIFFQKKDDSFEYSKA